MISVIQFLCASVRALIKISKPGGVKALVAENISLRQQLIALSRQHKRSPRLTTPDRILFGLLAGWMNPKRLFKIAILLKPATILKFHKALVKRKYHLLFSNKAPKKSGRKGPSDELIQLIIEMKKKNPRFGYLRIAMQIQQAFGVKLDKGVVKRVLDKHYKPTLPSDKGPSWLTFIGHLKDSLWSVDLFRVESIHLTSYWVMVVMDQFSRRIIGFSARKAPIIGIDVCCMFNSVISGKKRPKYLSSDHDPLFRFHRWRANLRILDVNEIKTVPYSAESHPFVERLIGSIRREYLDHLFFWNGHDLENKLEQFKNYYNVERAHSSLERKTPVNANEESEDNIIPIDQYRWKSHAHGLIKLPIAA